MILALRADLPQPPPPFDPIPTNGYFTNAYEDNGLTVRWYNKIICYFNNREELLKYFDILIEDRSNE